MLRLVLVGLLFVAVPALALAADAPKDNNGAGDKAKDSDKKDGKSDAAGPVTWEVEFQRSWYGRVVNLGLQIIPLVQIVLLCLILFALYGLRSEVAASMDKSNRNL